MAEPELEIGKKAPAFTRLNQDGSKVALRNLLGSWVVLYFYPRDNTPGCTKEACEFSTQLKQFEKLEAKVFGISPDSLESHQRFIEKQNLKIDLLSDPDHKLLEKFGAWGEKKMYGKTFQGVIRSTVLIDPKGEIAFHWSKVKPEGHAKEVREKLLELTS